MAAWPRKLRALAGEIGVQATALLLASYAGGRCYVPAKPKPGHRLVELIGLTAARMLAERHGGCYLEIPLAAPNLSDQIAGATGSAAQVAQAVGCSMRWVREARRRAVGKAAIAEARA